MSESPRPFTVVAVAHWNRKFGDPQNAGGIVGQVTHIRVGDVDAFVRENVHVDTFREMTSNRRRGVAYGAHMPGVQVLELAVAGDWVAVAELVRAADPKGRPVRQRRGWTVLAAMKVLRAAAARGGAHG